MGIPLFVPIQIINCEYTLEPHRQGSLNEYPQSMFWIGTKKKKKMKYTHVNFLAI